MAIKASALRANALICSGCVSLTKWTIYVDSRAKLAQSHQKRFSRWLHSLRINLQRLYMFVTVDGDYFPPFAFAEMLTQNQQLPFRNKLKNSLNVSEFRVRTFS